MQPDLLRSLVHLTCMHDSLTAVQEERGPRKASSTTTTSKITSLPRSPPDYRTNHTIPKSQIIPGLTVNKVLTEQLKIIQAKISKYFVL